MSTQEKSGKESRPAHAVLRWNLGLCLFAGTFVCWWLIRYTSWFAEFGAMLTLSGVLSWLAIIIKLAPEEKATEVKGAFFTLLFENRRALPFYGALCLALLAGSFQLATVQLTPLRESLDLPVQVYRSDSVTPTTGTNSPSNAEYLMTDDFETLSPGSQLRIVKYLRGRRSSQWMVKVSGYPEKRITLRPWERKELIVPNSFLRPVVLLRPSVTLMNSARQPTHKPWRLRVIFVASNETLEMPFDGHAVWLGCDENVEVPRQLRDLWDAEQPSPLLKPYWTYPQALTNAYRELKPGQAFEVQLIDPNDVLHPTSPNPYVVENIPSGQFFRPQIVDITVTSP